MQCPDCNGQLVTTADQGFNFLHCSSCHGKLIDEEILLRIETAMVEQASTSKQSAQADSREKSRRCPKFSYIRLDQGELEAIQASHALYQKKFNAKGSPLPTEFNCPKCGFAQQKKTECIQCGIIFSKFSAQDAIQNEQHYKSEQAASRVDAIFAACDSFEIKQIHE